MAAKSINELEQPAKVHQLIAVETKVDALTDMVKEVLQQTKGVATVGYVNGALEKLESDIKEYVDKEIADAKEAINAKYEPMQKEHEWVKYTVVGGIIMQLLVAGLLYIVTRGA